MTIETYEDCQKAIRDGLYDQCVNLMDDDLREEIHREMAPCEEIDFLWEYVQRHRVKFNEEFMI